MRNILVILLLGAGISLAEAQEVQSEELNVKQKMEQFRQNAASMRDSLNKKNAALCDSLKVKEKTIKRLEKEKEKQESHFGELENKYKKLQESLGKKNLEERQRQIDSLQNRISLLDSIVNDRELLISRLREDSVAHRLYMRKFESFVAEFTKKNLLSKRGSLDGLYSEMSLGALDSLRQQVIPFTADSMVKKFLIEIEATIVNKKLYVTADSLLNNPLDADGVYMAREEIELLKGDVSENQFVEFDNFDISLSRYAGAVLRFDEFVKCINSDIDVQDYREKMKEAEKDEKDEEFYRGKSLEIIRGIAQKEINSEIYNRYFDKIPFLKGLYDKYMKCLELNPLKVSPAEDIEKIEVTVKEMVEQAKKIR